MSNTSTNSGGIGFLGLLTLVFIVLKLTAVIAWSWLWVLSPLWMPIVAFLLFIVLLFGVAAVTSLFR
jgi:hypothetical protein